MIQIKTYTKLLESVLVRDEAGLPLVPELFYVPKDKVVWLFALQFTAKLFY